jgi:hypothetical protein
VGDLAHEKIEGRSFLQAQSYAIGAWTMISGFKSDIARGPKNVNKETAALP